MEKVDINDFLDAVSSLKILKEQYMSFGAELIDML
jgi:hypothetical protein